MFSGVKKWISEQGSEKVEDIREAKMQLEEIFQDQEQGRLESNPAKWNGNVEKAKQEDYSPVRTSKTITYQYPDGRKGWCGEDCYVPPTAKIIKVDDPTNTLEQSTTTIADEDIKSKVTFIARNPWTADVKLPKLEKTPRTKEEIALEMMKWHKRIRDMKVVGAGSQ